MSETGESDIIGGDFRELDENGQPLTPFAKRQSMPQEILIKS